jgi:hypothetical protein
LIKSTNGDTTVNLMETNISIDMAIIIVTTSAATLDYGIVIEVAIVIVAMHVIAATTDCAVHPPGSSNHNDGCSLTSRSRVRSQNHHGPRDHLRDGRNIHDRDEHSYSPEWLHRRSCF